MSSINIDPALIRESTTSFAKSVVLIEGVSAAANTAYALTMPFAFLVSSLDETLLRVHSNVNEIRSSCDNLVSTVNQCCTVYENGEERVYRLFDGQGDLYPTYADGGIAATFLEDAGRTASACLDGFTSKVADFWDDYGDIIIESSFRLIDVIGSVATIATATSITAAAGPVGAIVAIGAIGIAGIYLSNALTSWATNVSTMLNREENPNYNILEDFLEDNLGDEVGGALYFIGSILPAAATAGAGAAASGTKAVAGTISSVTANNMGTTASSASNGTRQVVKDILEKGGEEALKEGVENIAMDSLEGALEGNLGKKPVYGN